MKTPLKIALVGVGKIQKDNSLDGWRIGYQHAKSIAGWEDGELVAGVDLSQENLDAWLAEFGISRGYLDYAEMLATEKPDVVCISTYVGTHYPMIEQAAEAGVKGVLCEKPFLNSPCEIAKLRALIKKTGVRVVVNHMRRYQPCFVMAKNFLREGRIGAPELMSAGISDWDLAEWGSHWLDIFRFLNEDVPVEWVFGQARVTGRRAFGHVVEDHALAYFQFANGCKGFLDGGHAIGSAAIQITGSEGSIRIVQENHLILQTRSGWEEFYPDHYGPEVWLGPWRELEGWLRGGTEPQLGATNQCLTSELNHAAYLSALTGDRIDLPLNSDLNEWPADVIARRSHSKPQTKP